MSITSNQKIIVVADRGMLSSANIELTQEKGYEFIIGERLKNLPKKYQTEFTGFKSLPKSMDIHR